MDLLENSSVTLNLFELISHPFWVITLLCFIAIIRFLNIFNVSERPEVTFSNESIKGGHSMKELLDRCKILKEIYSPPLLWGRNGHIQTATYGLLGHTSLKRSYDKRYAVRLPDQSTVFFDVFEPFNIRFNEDDFTMVLCPGIANCSESNYIRTCVHYAQENGYRCAVLNHLGALPEIRLTSNRIFSYGGTEELEEVMNHLIKLYPKSKFISIGFSMGANITTRFLTLSKSEARQKVIIGLSVGQGYCAKRSTISFHDWENGRRAYNYLITENMKRLLRRHYDMAVLPHVKAGIIDEQQLWSATSLIAIDEAYNRRVLGYNTVDEFYADCSCISLLPKLQIPMVFLNVLDDPIMPPELWLPVREMAISNNYIGFILTKHGGHLGFLEGSRLSPYSITWLDRFIVELADAAISLRTGI